MEHQDNPLTWENDLIEKYDGLVPITKTENYRSLRFMMSNSGDNMAKIAEMKKKSTWIIKKIFDCLSSLNLKQYFFE